MLVWSGGAAHADRAALSHCAALLLINSIEGTSNQDGARKILNEFITRSAYLEAEAGRRLPYHGGRGDDADARVRLGVDDENLSFPTALTHQMLGLSVSRLSRVALDLTRPEVLGVVSEIRGAEQILAYLRKHEAVVRSLDADIGDERRIRLANSSFDRAAGLQGLAAVGAAGVIFETDVMAPASGLATATLAAIGAVRLLEPAEQLIKAQRERWPVHSVRRDDVEQFARSARRHVTTLGLKDVLAHVGFTVWLDPELDRELRGIHDVNAVSADLLLDAERVTARRWLGVDRRARLSVDQVLTYDDEDGEPVLLNIARLSRSTIKATTKSRPPKLGALRPGVMGAHQPARYGWPYWARSI